MKEFSYHILTNTSDKYVILRLNEITGATRFLKNGRFKVVNGKTIWNFTWTAFYSQARFLTMNQLLQLKEFLV